MSKVIVYRFRYFSRSSQSWELADECATALAIAQMGATIAPGSAVEIDAGVVTFSGLVSPNALPPGYSRS